MVIDIAVVLANILSDFFPLEGPAGSNRQRIPLRSSTSSRAGKKVCEQTEHDNDTVFVQQMR